MLVFLALSVGCAPGPTSPAQTSTANVPSIPPPPGPPFTLTVSPDSAWVGVGRQSGTLEGIVVPNNVHWEITVRASGMLVGSLARVEQVLIDRESRATLGSNVETGPFYGFGNTPNRVYDPLKTYGTQTLPYNLDLGFSGRASDLVTTVVIQDTTGGTWTLTSTVPWNFLPPPVPTSPSRIVVRQNDPATGCPFDPVHGYGFVLELAWEPVASSMTVTSYSVSVLDGRGTDLANGLLTERTNVRLPRCGMHIGPGAQYDARFGVRTYHAPSGGMSAYAQTEFDFQSCREAGVPACQ